MVPLVWLGFFPQIHYNSQGQISIALLNLVVNDENIVGKQWYDVSLACKPIMYALCVYEGRYT